LAVLYRFNAAQMQLAKVALAAFADSR